MNEKAFHKASAEIAFDLNHRKTIEFNISRYDAAVEKGKARYHDLEKARTVAAAIKREALQHWESYLLEFEKNATANGAEVLWAKDTNEANHKIIDILLENKARLLVKSKSMTTEEIDLNHTAESVGCRSVETDLGEFIVQIAGEKPYHIVTPAMHKSKGDIARLFHEQFATPIDSTPEEMTDFVRKMLRKQYPEAEIGVTGANFLIAETGSISVTENEGNGLMTTAFPKIHIVVAGIEKIIPKLNQLGLLYPVLASHGTGQQITAYNSIISGPRKSEEADGPERMYVVLLDNGRSQLFGDDESYESLACIRCGACLNACPVYKTIGGYTYNTTYSGPIGSVLTPFLKGFKDFSHLSFASTLCGKCVEVCPVKIPLTDILLTNRRKAVEQGYRPMYEKMAIKGFTFAASDRKRMDMTGGKIKNIVTLPLNKVGWGPNRRMPDFASQSFSSRMKAGSDKNKKN
jgi:L-lactate dehydrogenase complex protein LldF